MDCSRAAVTLFIARFERGEVSKAQWTHQAHLVAGYWYVSQLSAEQALEAMRTRISFHNEAVGTANTDSGGYHQSITRLYVQGIAALKAQQPTAGFEDGLQCLLASPMNSSSWPLQFTRANACSASQRAAVGWSRMCSLVADRRRRPTLLLSRIEFNCRRLAQCVRDDTLNPDDAGAQLALQEQ